MASRQPQPRLPFAPAAAAATQLFLSSSHTRSNATDPSESQKRRPVAARSKPKPKRSSAAATATAAPKKLRTKKSSSGPYSTVVSERAAIFNLTLDVQHLKQEIQGLTVARDILTEARAFRQRHDADGSLVRAVKMYYEMFRTGFNLETTPVERRRAHSGSEQRAFLQSIMDPEIDCGGGLFGIDVMTEMIRRYSIFMRFINLQLQSFEIVNADDSVLITTKGSMRFQILRSTIAGIFPHVIGHEWLVSKLVGREVEPAVSLSFYFNTRDRVCKYVVDLDFFQTFSDLLTDPVEVEILFGRALIGANCMVGDDAPPPDDVPVAAAVTDTHRRQRVDTTQLVSRREAPRSRRRGAGLRTQPVSILAIEDTPPQPPLERVDTSSRIEQQATRLRQEIQELKTLATRSERASQAAEHRSRTAPESLSLDYFSQVVWHYYVAFGKVGTERSRSMMAAQRHGLSDEQRAFARQSVSPSCEFGDSDGRRDGLPAASEVRVGVQALEERWRALTTSFELLAFVQTSQDPLVFQREDGVCFVRTTAQYVLRISRNTIRSVFPHVAADDLLAEALLGAVITVRAELKFWLESDSAQIACLRETMDFRAALEKFVSQREDLDWVMAHALLAKDGVSVRAAATASATAVAETSVESLDEHGHEIRDEGSSDGDSCATSGGEGGGEFQRLLNAELSNDLFAASGAFSGTSLSPIA